MKFCTAVNCMDGRVQSSVIDFLKERFRVEYVDMITEPGPCRILGEESETLACESVMHRVDKSLTCHGSTAIAVVGHHDCGGNPAPQERQAGQIRDSVALLRGRFPGIAVIGLWVGEDWCVSEIA